MMETTSAHISKEYIKPNIERFIIDNIVDLLLIDCIIVIYFAMYQIIFSSEILFKPSLLTYRME